MSDHEAMPVDLKNENSVRDTRSTRTNVSRESSFSSVELGASNSVSRESSFSSSGSGVFDGESSYPASRSNSCKSNEDQSISRITDLQYERLHNARARYRKAREVPSSESSSTEQLQSSPEKPQAMVTLKRPEVHGRSISDPQIGLSPMTGRRSPRLSATSPDGLVIATPQPKGFIEYRIRSRSFTGSEHGDGERADINDLQDFSQSSHLQVPCKAFIETSKRVTPQFRGGDSNDLTKDKNSSTSTFSEEEYALLQKERDDLREDRDDLKRECERLQCERDAMQLERDTLLREKQQLLAELNNRNEVIHHLQDHVAMSLRTSVVVSEESSTACSSKRQQRSQSEVHRPAFYLPGEIPERNSYTCL